MLQKQTKAKMIFALLFIPILLITASLTSNTLYNHAFAQSSDLICSDAIFTPSLPQSFTSGTSIPFTVDFGTTFNTISKITAISTYDNNDAFGNGDKYFIDNYGGQDTQPGTVEVTSMTLHQIDPTVLSQFIDGTFQGKYIDNNGKFTLTSLKFCITGEPLQQGICPAKNVEHWDKIVFMITNPDIAKNLNLTANTELDIKVLDNPLKVADIKQKVIDFLHAPEGYKGYIKILAVDYAIICKAPSL